MRYNRITYSEEMESGITSGRRHPVSEVDASAKSPKSELGAFLTKTEFLEVLTGGKIFDQ